MSIDFYTMTNHKKTLQMKKVENMKERHKFAKKSYKIRHCAPKHPIYSL